MCDIVSNSENIGLVTLPGQYQDEYAGAKLCQPGKYQDIEMQTCQIIMLQLGNLCRYGWPKRVQN